jgi:hypothetical protein
MEADATGRSQDVKGWTPSVSKRPKLKIPPIISLGGGGAMPTFNSPQPFGNSGGGGGRSRVKLPLKNIRRSSIPFAMPALGPKKSSNVLPPITWKLLGDEVMVLITVPELFRSAKLTDTGRKTPPERVAIES